MVRKELLFIKNNEIELESEYFGSKSMSSDVGDKRTTAAGPVVLITHPHPQYGGNMYNNVVSSVFNKIINNDFSCLRFNFRGVGKSTGKHSGGPGELSDVKSCIDYLINKKYHERIIICGYSYGAAIGCSAINYSENIIGYISISFPWDFMGAKYRELSQSNKPKLFIQGNQDTVAVYERFEENFNFYLDPKISKIIEGADHFYMGYELQVADEVLKFYNSII